MPLIVYLFKWVLLSIVVFANLCCLCCCLFCCFKVDRQNLMSNLQTNFDSVLQSLSNDVSEVQHGNSEAVSEPQRAENRDEFDVVPNVAIDEAELARLANEPQEGARTTLASNNG